MMPSNRRLKGFFLLVVLLVLLTLYITASGRQTRSSQFYTKTQDAMSAAKAAKEASLAGNEHALGEDDMVSHRLKAAEEAAKRKADEKADVFHGEEAKQKALKVKESLRDDDVEEDESSSQSSKSSKASKSSKSSTGGRKVLEEGEKAVAGRVIMKDPKEAVLRVEDEVEEEEDDDDDDEEEKGPHEETEDERKAHSELNDILKKSPIIIFSKTYCPYSRRAKHILLEKYKISPPPYVVELDIHPLGKELQAYLGGITGRKTVPNILIRAKSIGGGDDLQDLDERGKLMSTVRSMGGKQMQIEKVLTEAQKEAKRKRDEEAEAKKKKRHFWS